MNSASFIGVDVAQRTLDIAVGEHTTVQHIANTQQAIEAWLQQLPSGCRIALESTGSLHLRLVRCAIAAGHTVYVPNPRDLAHYACSLGRRAKTDRLDAQLIARYLQREHEQLHPYCLPSASQTEFDELIGRRHQVVRAQVSLRLSFAGCAHTPLPALRDVLTDLQNLTEQIDERMQQLIDQDERLAQAARHLRTIVGFGPLLSASLAHALRRRTFRNADSFVAYLGYDPRVRESGQWRGRRFLSKRGSPELRRLLFVGAMSACRSDTWKAFYQRYRDRGLSSTAALVILARKLARTAFSMLKYDQDFSSERIQHCCVHP